MCRPFHRSINCFRKQLDVRNSIIKTFATFLLLSYVKVFCVSSNLLIPTHVYSVHGSLLGVYLQYDTTIAYLGEEHLPYDVLVVFVMLVFILFLYYFCYRIQCGAFRCLGCCGIRWHALLIFIDTFQGCYKDGTNGNRDCWYFAACLNFAFYNFLSQNTLWCSTGSFNTFSNSSSHHATLQAQVFNIQCCRLSISPSNYPPVVLYVCFSEAIIYSALLFLIQSSFVSEHVWSGQFAYALCEGSFVLPFKICFFFLLLCC